LTDWEQVRQAYAPLVWGVVVRILRHEADALDCFQDVFAEAIERDRGAAVANWGAVLRWLATRRAIDTLRRRARLPLVGVDAEPVGSMSSSAEHHASFLELVEIVRRELAVLSNSQAEAFWLVCVEEQSYDEVAEAMGLSKNTVGVLVHRARQHLRTKLKSLNPAPSRLESEK
jgi:RNA polymerase sigma factor (sigma-70 family)